MPRLLSLLLLAVDACTPQPIPAVALDPADAAYALGTGPNRIDGRIELRNPERQRYSCFRQRVVLVPAIGIRAAYAASSDRLSDRQALAMRLKPGTAPDARGPYRHATRCDIGDRFNVIGIPGGADQSEAMMLTGDGRSDDVLVPVTVLGGGVTDLVISPPLQN
ncbi:MAG: hypothetical protein AAGC92_02200 [Pseudomonadota bacterium]